MKTVAQLARQVRAIDAERRRGVELLARVLARAAGIELPAQEASKSRRRKVPRRQRPGASRRTPRVANPDTLTALALPPPAFGPPPISNSLNLELLAAEA